MVPAEFFWCRQLFPPLVPGAAGALGIGRLTGARSYGGEHGALGIGRLTGARSYGGDLNTCNHIRELCKPGTEIPWARQGPLHNRAQGN